METDHQGTGKVSKISCPLCENPVKMLEQPHWINRLDIRAPLLQVLVLPCWVALTTLFLSAFQSWISLGFLFWLVVVCWLVCFSEQGLTMSSCCPRTHTVVQDGLELTEMHLPLPPKPWDCVTMSSISLGLLISLELWSNC